MPSTNMPLSPAPSHSGDIIQHGLHHIAQHNAASPYPQEQYYPDEGVHLQSNYSSPTPAHEEAYGYHGGGPARFPYQQHQHQDSGMEIHYENFNPDYHGVMYHNYSTPATSPPIPSMSSQDMMRTRSGYAIPRTHQTLKPMPDGRIRSEKSPKPKKVKKEKIKAEKKVAKLDKPLSELTKDWKHVPVADIETYVNRSAEERRREVEEGKIPGKVKRPMNSFMLYRKAYQNRTKDWCLQNNHQVVSQVCGDSWPLEPEEVKEQFNEWARLERQNHQNAHPGYKFSPTKPGTTKTSKRKMSEDVDTEESDLDDFEWQGMSSRRKRARLSPRSQPQMPVEYPTTRSAYNYSSRDNSVEPLHGGYTKSSFHFSNPGRPMPPPYNQSALNSGEYYQQTIQTNPNFAGVQDVLLRKAVAPGMHSFLGLPGGGQDYDIMNQYPQQKYESAPHGGENRIDPSLISHGEQVYNGASYTESHPEGVYFGGSHNCEQQWQQSPYVMELNHQGGDQQPVNYLDPELDAGMHLQDQHAHGLRVHQEGWHIESLDAGEGAFDKWMDGE